MERKVVLITGGAMGQGKSHALKFAENGFDVVLADMQDPEGETFKQTVAEIEAAGAKALAVRANITSDEDMQNLFEKAWKTFGRIDVVVANAGVINFGYTWELTDAQVQKVIDIDLIGTWRTDKYAALYMRKQGFGRIINISSTSGMYGTPKLATYCMAKWGVRGLTKTLAQELKGTGIVVNTVCPTTVKTPMCETDSYVQFINDLTGATGAQFSEFALAESIKVYNEHNAAMRAFSEAAANADITAAERSDVFKSAWFMLPEEHTAIVKELTAELLAGPKSTRTARVLVSGILADAPGMLKIFDDNGIQIVADDVANETRQYRTDTPEMTNPVDALAQKFANMDNCTLLYDKEKKRVDYIIEQAKAHDAKGIIVLMTKFCDPEEFDYVPIKRACEQAGLLNLNIEVDRQMVNYEQAATMIQAFKEML